MEAGAAEKAAPE